MPAGIPRRRRPLADKDINTPLATPTTTTATTTTTPNAAVLPLQNVDAVLLTPDKLAEVAATIPQTAADELYAMAFPKPAIVSNKAAEPDQDDSDLDQVIATSADMSSNAASQALRLLTDESSA
jgi:hypothetical protein